MTEMAKQVGEIRADVGLAAPGEPHGDDLLVRLVCGGAGRRQTLDLIVILDRPKHRQGGCHRNVGRLGQSILQAEEVHGPSRVRDGVMSGAAISVADSV